MSDIPSIASQPARQPAGVDQILENAKASGLTAKSAQLVKEVASLLGGRGVTVSASTAARDTATGTVTGATGAPALDNPDSEKCREANLEKLVAFLQLDNEERQAQMAKDRIETNKDSFKKEHEERKGKIQKSLDEIAKAEKARTASRVFGWLMAAVAVIVAAVACVATGGIAVGAVVGAVVAVGMQTASELGAMDKLTEAIADLFEKAGMGKEAAKIAAAIFVTVAIIAASVAAGAGANAIANKLGLAGKALFGVSESVKASAEAAQSILSKVSHFVQIGSVATAAGTAVVSYSAGQAGADVTEAEKFIAALKQRMEESQQELEAILQAIQNGIAQVAQLISSATDTAAEIAGQIGQMA